jgi:hypothetical protein
MRQERRLDWLGMGRSCIIDGFALFPEAGIDLRRIAMTGRSRCGKGALAMGAFDERVALTIPKKGVPVGWTCGAFQARRRASEPTPALRTDHR